MENFFSFYTSHSCERCMVERDDQSWKHKIRYYCFQTVGWFKIIKIIFSQIGKSDKKLENLQGKGSSKCNICSVVIANHYVTFGSYVGASLTLLLFEGDQDPDVVTY